MTHTGADYPVSTRPGKPYTLVLQDFSVKVLLIIIHKSKNIEKSLTCKLSLTNHLSHSDVQYLRNVKVRVTSSINLRCKNRTFSNI